MSTVMPTVESPKTLNERRLQAEEIYDMFYSAFGTHCFTDWQEPDGENYISAFPPYCYRFDEYLGISIGIIKDMGPILNRIFPNPDTTDLLYIEDTLFLLDKTIGYGILYNCVKGSKLAIVPELYRKNVVQVYNWLEIKKKELASQGALKHVAKQSSKRLSDNQLMMLSSKLFLNGFTIEKFTTMLVVLGILTESGEHTSDSKPRNWRAVIECLREQKFLIPNASTALFNFLKEQYSYQFKIRAIQSSFNSKNIDTESIYKRAHELCLTIK